MGLKAEIQETVKRAMKSGDRVTLSTLRLLLSAVHNEEIRLRRELATEDIQRTISTLCKQRAEAIELYRKTGWVEIPRFNDDPYPDVFFEKTLSPRAEPSDTRPRRGARSARAG